MATFDGNRDQHLANGGCHAVHSDGKTFCQGREGHYSHPGLSGQNQDNRHYSRAVRIQGGRPVESVAVVWN